MRTTYLWLVQLFSGILILVLSVAHLASIHLRVILRFFGVETSASASGQASGSSWTIFLVALSAAILVHSLFGLRQTVTELGISARKLRLISWAIAGAGILLFIGAAGLPALIS